MAKALLKVLSIIILLCCFSACTTVTIDEVKHSESQLVEGETIVVIGRRSGSDYETEPELISCIGGMLSQGSDGLNVIPEETFVDDMYPWFEPRTAPVKVKDLQRLLSFNEISKKFDDFNVHYIIWVDGNTETTRSSGSISCALSAAGVSCFGFGTWDKKAEYEASIWDYKKKKLIGRVSSEADGTSYMPAIVIPIPIIAPVQADACKGMAQQLKLFFDTDEEEDDDSE